MCIKDVHGNIWSHAEKCCADVMFLRVTHTTGEMSLTMRTESAEGLQMQSSYWTKSKKGKRGKNFKQNKVGFKKQISCHTTNQSSKNSC